MKKTRSRDRVNGLNSWDGGCVEEIGPLPPEQGEDSPCEEFFQEPADPHGPRALFMPRYIVCTDWNRSASLIPRPSEMRYSVSIEAEFLPSSICDR